VPPFAALRGRSSVPSPQPQAVGSQSCKKSLQARFFAAATPAACGFAGFPPTPSRSQLAHTEVYSPSMRVGAGNRYQKRR